MNGSGANGLVQGIIAGIQPGQIIGDAIARKRYANKMSDIQDQIDAGAYSNDAAGQQQLQEDIRKAGDSSLVTGRGLRGVDGQGMADTDYARLRGQGAMRLNQQGGDDIVNGDIAGGAGMAAQSAALNGDIAGAAQAKGWQGQIANGNANIQPDGTVDQQGLAEGQARVSASMGATGDAAQWGDQAKTRRDAAVQGQLGRALTVAVNPALGGPEAAAPMLHSAALLMGYGDLQYSPTTKTFQILAKDGSVNASFGIDEMQQFAQTIGNDPSQILSNLRANQSATAQHDIQRADEDHKATLGASLDIAKSPFDTFGLQAATDHAATLEAQATKAGWSFEGSAIPVNDAKGNPTGAVRYMAKPSAGGPGYIIEVSNGADPSDPTSGGYKVLDANGNGVDPNNLPTASGGGSVATAAAAARAKAQADWYKMNLASRTERLREVSDITRGGGGGGGAPVGMGNGAAGNYLSPNAQYNGPQMQQESGGNQAAVSPKGATGVMQLMPATARQLEQQYGYPPGSSDTNPQINAELGQRYRDTLMSTYTQKLGDPFKGHIAGLVAYNYGPGNADKWLARGGHFEQLPAETQQYVRSIMAQAQQQPAPQQLPSVVPQAIPGQMLSRMSPAAPRPRGGAPSIPSALPAIAAPAQKNAALGNMLASGFLTHRK